MGRRLWQFVVGAAEDGWRGWAVGRQVGRRWIDRRLGRGGGAAARIGARLGERPYRVRAVGGELRDEFTIFAMDRRGFGASRDDPGYSAEREFSDVAAVVDAVAARAGEPVVLFGSPFGASCALGAARDLPSLRALLYEPSMGMRYPPGSIDRIEERIAAGDNEGAIVELATRIAGLTEDQIAERRAAPNWSQRVATAPTIVREARIEQGWAWQSERFAGIAVPTLLITGSETPPELAEVTSLTAAAIPGARVHVLAGHGHVAHVSEPGVVAQVLRNWLE